MKKIKLVLQLILFATILLICSKVEAASITLAPNKSTATVGEELTISMNLSGASLASLNVKITVDTSKVEYISSSAPNNTNFNNGRILYTWTDASGGSNPKTDGTIVTFRLRAKAVGTASFSVSGKFYDTNENSLNLGLNGTSVTIKFDWHDILKTFKIDSSTQPKCGTLRELIELTNDKEYLDLINDENYLKLLEEKDKLYRLDIDLPF